MTDNILSTSIFALIIAVAIAALAGLVETEKRLDIAVAAAASAAHADNATRMAGTAKHHEAHQPSRANGVAS